MALLDNLISYWSLDEASGNAIDSRGANDLTDTNTVGTGTGKVGNARVFVKANSEYFTHADNADLSLGDIDFSFACWAKFQTGAVGNDCIVAKEGAGPEFRLFIDAGFKFTFGLTDDGTFAGGHWHTVSATSVTTAYDTWYFVVAWHDSVTNTINIQVNDGTVHSLAHTGGGYNGAGAFQIGALNGTLFWNGLIDEIAFWKRALTTDERTFLYNSGNGRSYSSLIPPEITTTTLPDGSIGVAYSELLAVTGGAGSIAWSVVSGALPGGLTLNAATGEISGTPTTAETAIFTVRATDDNDLYDEQALSIVITFPEGVFPSYIFTGRRPRREQESAPDWQTITDSYEFEDGSKTFNEVASVAPVRWEYQIEINETTAAEAIDTASLYHDFFNTVRHSQPFEFTDKFGTVWTDVRVESYERSHDAHKSWTVYINFVLVSFTGATAPAIEPEPEPGPDADATAFLTAAGITDDTIEAAVDDLVVALKAAGVWTKCNAIYPFVGGDATKHSYNLKNPATFQLTWVGTVTHNSNGITGNGSTGYGNTGLNMLSVLTVTDIHLSVYSRTDDASNIVDIGAMGTAAQQYLLFIRDGTGNTTLMLGGGNNNIAVASPNSLGQFIVTRRADTDMEAYKNGSSIGTDADAATTLPSQNMYIGCGNNAGSASFFSNRNLAFASIGSGLTDAEAAAFYTAVQAFQTALTRNV